VGDDPIRPTGDDMTYGIPGLLVLILVILLIVYLIRRV
jgi:hypothetical protein